MSEDKEDDQENEERSEEQNEQMLSAWLRLTTAVSNERIVKDMTFNEALICHILYQMPEGASVTATDLCEETRMLKSQMNRTLHTLEEKGWIVRERSKVDQRRIKIKGNPKKLSDFLKVHRKNVRLVGEILDRYGRGRTEELVRDFCEVAKIAEEVFS